LVNKFLEFFSPAVTYVGTSFYQKNKTANQQQQTKAYRQPPLKVCLLLVGVGLLLLLELGQLAAQLHDLRVEAVDVARQASVFLLGLQNAILVKVYLRGQWFSRRSVSRDIAKQCRATSQNSVARHRKTVSRDIAKQCRTTSQNSVARHRKTVSRDIAKQPFF
jgi:hypothetical protein